jgi:CDP-2,3-bis-(O-geranylgeranyl)-sn-glycerol synthase
MDEIILLILCVIIFLLPAYIANTTGLVLGGKTPIDRKKNFVDGKRIIGDGVTWEGLISGIIVGSLIGLIEGVVLGKAPYDMLFFLKLGFLLSLGALLGDAIGSFIKRRLGLDKGQPAPILDQLDFFVGAILFASLIIKIPTDYIIVGAILTLILHISTNAISYLLGIKDVWY